MKCPLCESDGTVVLSGGKLRCTRRFHYVVGAAPSETLRLGESLGPPEVEQVAEACGWVGEVDGVGDAPVPAAVAVAKAPARAEPKKRRPRRPTVVG